MIRIKRDPREGYVYYENLGEIGSVEAWKKVKSKADDYFNQVRDTAYSEETVLDSVLYLRKLAYMERVSELKLLEDFLGTSEDTSKLLEKDLVRIMTENFEVRAEAERAYDMIEKDLEGGSDYRYNVPKLLHSYLLTAIEARLGKYTELELLVFLEEKKRDDNTFYKLIEESVDEAVENMIGAIDKNEDGFYSSDSQDVWNSILLFYKYVQDFRSRFVKTAYQQFGFREIEESIKGEWKEALLGPGMRKTKKKGNLLREKIRVAVQKKVTPTVSALVGGNLQEILAPVLAQLGVNKGALTTNFKMQDWVTKGLDSIDVVTVISEFGATIELEMLDAPAKNKRDAAAKYSAFFNEMKKHQKAHILYQSTKLYGLGKAKFEGSRQVKGFRGFAGSSINFQSATDLLNAVGYDQAEALLQKINQTAIGAMYRGEMTVMRKNAGELMARYIAHFLFDDWEQIGVQVDGGPNVIRYFNLSNFIIPLSVLLYRLSDALEGAYLEIKGSDPTAYVDVRFNVPKIKYTGYEDEGGLGDGVFLVDSERRWKEQVKHAQKSTVNVTFLKNFRTFLTNDLKDLFK